MFTLVDWLARLEMRLVGPRTGGTILGMLAAR
jgi:hypothetical protein